MRYEFKAEDAERFAFEQHIKTKKKGNDLVFIKCPYCGASSNDKEKFAINLRTGQFNCFRASCRAKGNMLTLSRDFGFSLGREVDEYYTPRRTYRVWKEIKPEEPQDEAIEYMQSRGISKETARKYYIRERKDKQGIVIPFLDPEGKVQTIKYRNPAPKEGQNKEWAEPNCKPILFGMYQCDLTNKMLIVTEGQMDSLSVSEAGIANAVSVPAGANGYTWVPYCWDWMQQFEKIIVFGDHEKGHITLYEDFCQRWGAKVWHVREEDYKDCKDANDILIKYGAEQIRRCIDNAIQAPLPKVINLADVEDVDIESIEKIPTGISELDTTLHGGLPKGQVVLITGKAGDGKSTLANYMLLNAIDAGNRAFVYSGELPNFLLKNWMMLQAAGVEHIDENNAVRPDIKKKISEWFRDYVWIYDNRSIENEEDEPVYILRLIEDVIIRNGVSVILLDNLMTAMDLDEHTETDKYEKQSLFLKKLARLALKYNVLIILVAHKRKSNGSDGTNDAVMGSSDIVNLASIVISYERVPKKASDLTDVMNQAKKRIIRVTKNRLFGELNDKGFDVMFEPKSRRVYCENDMHKEFGWADGSEGFEEIPDEIALPWEL